MKKVLFLIMLVAMPAVILSTEEDNRYFSNNVQKCFDTYGNHYPCFLQAWIKSVEKGDFKRYETLKQHLAKYKKPYYIGNRTCNNRGCTVQIEPCKDEKIKKWIKQGKDTVRKFEKAVAHCNQYPCSRNSFLQQLPSKKRGKN